MPWAPGDEIEWREVWQGHVLLTWPVRVVADRDDLLAVFIAEGALFTFPDRWPWAAQHPWAARGAWEGHGVLILHRPGDPYTVWVFWEGPDRTFAGFYVNFQAPIVRGERSLDTFDHELDISVHPDGTWEFKDDELLDHCIREGRFSAADVAAIRSAGRRVADELEHGRQWWDDVWASWELPG